MPTSPPRSLVVIGLLLMISAVALNPWTVAGLVGVAQFRNPWVLGTIVAGEIALGVWGYCLPRRPWARTLLFAAIPSLICYFLIECVAVLLIFRQEPDWFREQRVQTALFMADPVIGFKFRPHLRGQEFAWGGGAQRHVVDTDELGFRNVGHDYSKARVFAIGDSFVFGSGATREESAVGQAGTVLGEEVLGLGVPGYEPSQYEIVLDQLLGRYRPSVVAVCVFVNDIRAPTPPADYAFGQRTFEKRFEAYSLRHRTLAFHLLRRYLQRGGARFQVASNGITLFERTAVDLDYFRQHHELSAEALIERLIRKAQQHGVQLVLFTLPSKESAYREDYVRLFGHAQDLEIEEQAYQRLLALGKRKGITAVDLTPTFRQAGGHLYFDLDSHWNAAGNALAGKVMANTIRDLLPHD